MNRFNVFSAPASTEGSYPSTSIFMKSTRWIPIFSHVSSTENVSASTVRKLPESWVPERESSESRM